MDFIVKPSAVGDATLRVPGDKSISHRALMFGAIAEGRTAVSGFLPGEDCLSTLGALRAMGVPVERRTEDQVIVDGVGLHGLAAPDGPLDLGNSGTAMRLFCGLLAGQPFACELTGDRSLSSRPMGRVTLPLQQMGARIDSNDGRPPLRIRGGRTLHGIDYRMPVASAQVKSALLLAGLYANGPVTVHEPGVTRDHTERLLRALGADLESADGTVTICGGKALRARDIEVPADLSSATFPILAALLSDDATVVVENVGVNPTRDGVITILRQMGADIRLLRERRCGDEPVADIEVRASRLRGIELDPALAPLAIDEFPALFVAAACAGGVSEFRGLAELRVKESDRISAMAGALAALGADVEELSDGARIRGGALTGGVVESHGDHRIAMATAVAATRARAPVCIRDTAAVATSFPGFAECLEALGVDISVVGGPEHGR